MREGSDHLLHVVMNGHVVGDIHRSGRQLRLRYPETLRQWRRQFSVTDDLDPFPLLQHVGEDVAGAAQFVVPTRLKQVLARAGSLDPLSPSAVADMLRRAQADLPLWTTRHRTGKFSLAGAQAKIRRRSGQDRLAPQR